jgi:hypothetical protein
MIIKELELQMTHEHLVSLHSWGYQCPTLFHVSICFLLQFGLGRGS